MFTLHDLNTGIAKCQGLPDPKPEDAIKLAAFYTIKSAMFGDDQAVAKNATTEIPGYSNSSQPEDAPETYVDFNSGTDFSRAIDGKEAYSAWVIMDELLTVLQATNPRLFDGVMRKISQI